MRLRSWKLLVRVAVLYQRSPHCERRLNNCLDSKVLCNLSGVDEDDTTIKANEFMHRLDWRFRQDNRHACVVYT